MQLSGPSSQVVLSLVGWVFDFASLASILEPNGAWLVNNVWKTGAMAAVCPNILVNDVYSAVVIQGTKSSCPVGLQLE